MKEKDLIKLEDKINSNAEAIVKVLKEVESNSSKIQTNSIALDILRDYKKERDRAFIVIIVLLIIVVMLASIVIYHHWSV